MIKSLKSIVALLLVAVAIFSVSCKKKETCYLKFPVSAAFVADWGESTTLSFTYRNAETLEVRTITGGWSAELDKATKSLKITAPASESVKGANKIGTIHVVGVAKGGDSEGAVIYAYIVDDDVDLSANGTQSNCYVITKPNVKYRFNACVKGNTTESIPTAKVKLLWAEDYEDLNYIYLDNEGYASFFVGYGEDDNGDALTTAPKGNAVVAAYDSAGNILWSWHLWLTGGDDPRDGFELSNGVTMMDFNLGAWSNPEGSTAPVDIWQGYGLYYQWGRKDPFMRPEYYDCAQNYDESIYGDDGDYVYVAIKPTDATKGTIDYTVKHPMTFLTSTAKNQCNWLYENHRNDLWSASGRKSEYDPCPHGWRVPAKDAFEVLDIGSAEDNMPLEQAEKLFGWALTDSGTGNKHFFPASGYHSYLTGILSNMNYRDEYPYTPKPWVGYYWTAGVGSEAATSSAMYFDLNTSRATVNGYKAITDQKRGNAMQVRCVKDNQ